MGIITNDAQKAELETLKAINEEAYKDALRLIKVQNQLNKAREMGSRGVEGATLKIAEYEKELKKLTVTTSKERDEMVKLQTEIHKTTKKIEFAKKVYGGLTSAIDKAAAITDKTTGLNTTSLLGMKNLYGAVMDYSRALQGLEVELRRNTGYAKRHIKAFHSVRGEYHKLGLTNADTAKSLSALSTQFGAFDSLTAANRDSIALTAAEYKTLGVEFEDFAKLNERLKFSFGIMGSNAGQAAAEIKKIALETGRPLKSVVNDLNDLGPELARFGSDGIRVFKELSKRARSLGLTTREAFDVSELFDTFEGAANIAGRLNAQLGLQLNSVELMKGSSEERVDLLRQEFQMQGKSFDSMGRRQKQMVAGILGKDIETTGKLLGDGMDISAFQAEAATKGDNVKLEEKAIATMEALTEKLADQFGGVQAAIKLQAAALNKVAENLGAAAGTVTTAGVAKDAGSWVQTGLSIASSLAMLAPALGKLGRGVKGLRAKRLGKKTSTPDMPKSPSPSVPKASPLQPKPSGNSNAKTSPPQPKPSGNSNAKKSKKQKNKERKRRQKENKLKGNLPQQPKAPQLSPKPLVPTAAAKTVTKLGATATGAVAGAAQSAVETGAKSATKVGTKGAAKLGVKGLGKSLLKKIPGIGLGMGILFAGQRAMAGDFSGAGLELLSGVASTVPGLGTAASVGLDAALMAKDMGAFSSSSEAPASPAGVNQSLPPSTPSSQSSSPQSIVVKELTLPIRLVVDGREFTPIIEKALNITLNPMTPA